MVISVRLGARGLRRQPKADILRVLLLVGEGVKANAQLDIFTLKQLV